jgi:sugar lactone lactonase YvrE
MVSAVSNSVFYDGFADSPRLAHPEGIAVHHDGSIWCGSETGQVWRIAADGSSATVVADVGGFVLGIAFDSQGMLFLCHQTDSMVYRLNTATGDIDALYPRGAGPELPNYLIVDEARNRLLVSDSHRQPTNHPSIWEIDLGTGECKPWLSEPVDFANGLALSLDGQTLFMVASWDKAVSKVSIGRGGQAGPRQLLCDELPGIPDGLAILDDEHLIVSLYEPSALLVVDSRGRVSTLIHDDTAHLICHPTNVAFRGRSLFVANLGRWHITHLELDKSGPASSFPHDLVPTRVG